MPLPSPILTTGLAVLLLTACMPLTSAPPALCYQLIKGPWSTPIPTDSDSALYTPPPMFHFLMARDSARSHRRQVKGFPNPESLPAYRTEGTWYWSAKDSLTVTWGDDFTGVVLEMAVQHDTLHGVAQLYTDYLRYPYSDATAPVLGAPVPCPASS